jgi:hypothetical protein
MRQCGDVRFIESTGRGQDPWLRITSFIIGENNFNVSVRKTEMSDVAERNQLGRCYRPEQTTPRQNDGDAIGHSHKCRG